MFLAAGCIVTCVPTGLMKLLKLAVKSPKFILKSVQMLSRKCYVSCTVRIYCVCVSYLLFTTIKYINDMILIL